MSSNNNRAFSLDALRGYAIITMVLSGQIAMGPLPLWMYHAQVPPGGFNPSIFGITWVDLVFPFFLFAMGAAFPLSIGRKIANGQSKALACWHAIERGIKMTFFAIFIQHMYSHCIASPPDSRAFALTLVGFALLFPMYMRIPGNISNLWRRIIEYGAYASGIALMLWIDHAAGREFKFSSNIIILVLANMALFGSIIYIFTINNKWHILQI